MKNLFPSIASAAIVACLGAPFATAEPVFNRIASWPVSANLALAGKDLDTETSAEIIEVTADGMMLVYTDSSLEALGMIDITDPKAPKPAGVVVIGGEPTSVAVVGGRALVVVDTTNDKSAPTGHLAVVDLASKTIVQICDLGGQPDSIAVSPDGSFAAIAIENELDEDVGDGALPQPPPGNLTIFPLTGGTLDCNARKVVDLTGLAHVASQAAQRRDPPVHDRGPEPVQHLQRPAGLLVVGDVAPAQQPVRGPRALVEAQQLAAKPIAGLAKRA